MRKRLDPVLVRLVLLAVSLVFSMTLTGCPADDTAAATAAPGSASPQATAPTLPAAEQQGAPQAGVDTATAQTAPKSAHDPSFIAARNQQLINSAEQAYNSGVNNYRADRLDAARIDFDFAVDLMLRSGYDLKGDPQLAEEFEHLLNAVNALELNALKQGNGFSPKIEEAPLESAQDLTFAANPELVAKLKSELNTTSDLPLVINDQVAGYIGVFSGSESFRKHMAASLQRVGKYRGLIQSVLKEEGVPQDLIYLAVSESGFQPQVVNTHSGAGGMWQFMTYTGPEFGLARNGYFDYRFDPEKSSRAYAKYIKQLYNQFGDWYLAMAAYNWGPGNIQRDVQKTGYADFWEFYRRGLMPAQTRAYVPQILAAILMAKNPERYGLDKLVPSPPVIYDTVPTEYAIDLRLVADVTNSTVQELVALNPALLRLSTPPDIPFDLHVPPGTAELYAERLKLIPEEHRTSWRFHEVKAGESLELIAGDLHVHAADVAAANGLAAGEAVEAGDELVVPVASVSSAASHPQRYTARRGDTLVTVADRFNVSVEELRKWNGLRSNSVTAGRSLNVAEPLRLAPSGHSRVYAGRRERASRTTHAAKSSAASSRARAFTGASSKPAHGTTSKVSTTPRSKGKRS